MPCLSMAHTSVYVSVKLHERPEMKESKFCNASAVDLQTPWPPSSFAPTLLFLVDGHCFAFNIEHLQVAADKMQEVEEGHCGSWVAHPDLAKVAMDVYNK